MLARLAVVPGDVANLTFSLGGHPAIQESSAGSNYKTTDCQQASPLRA